MARIIVNGKGVQALLRDPGVKADLRRRAERVRSAIQGPKASGDFLASLSVVEDVTDRAVVRVVSSDPAALVIEAEHGTMTAALDAAGGA